MAYANPFQTATPTTSPTTAPPGTNPGTPAWRQWYLNYNPEAGFVEYLNNRGLFGLDPRSTYARNQFGRTQSLYNVAAADNPNLGFYDWLNANSAKFSFGEDYLRQTPDQRGDFSDQRLAPRARFMRAY